MGLRNVSAPVFDSDAINKEYADTKYDKSGGTIDGWVKIDDSSLVDGQRVFSVGYKSDPKFYVHTNGKTINRYNIGPEDTAQTVVNKAYVDQVAGGSTFRVVECDNTGEMKDGDIWFMSDKAYISWKTLEGRIWCPNPTEEDWKTWPEGTERNPNAGHTRNIPDSYMAYESVEDG